MFPRHVLEHMVLHPPSQLGTTATPDVNRLAHKHKNVTLMFMDIIGEASGAGGWGAAGDGGRRGVGRRRRVDGGRQEGAGGFMRVFHC